MELDEETVATLPPFIEVEYVYQKATSAMEELPWRAFEVWTTNNRYSCDWNMVCVEVVDKKTMLKNVDNVVLGCRLAGGQSAEDGEVELSYPFPRPGTEAVFEHPKRRGYITTSCVIRMVLRLRIVTVGKSTPDAVWDDLTGG